MGLYQAIVDNPIRNSIGNFLQTEVYKSNLVSLDLWSVVHIASGMGLMWILILWKKKTASRYWWLLWAVVLYEVVEVFLYTNLTTLFIPEKFINVFWDILVAMFGGLCVDLLYRKT